MTEQEDETEKKYTEEDFKKREILDFQKVFNEVEKFYEKEFKLTYFKAMILGLILTIQPIGIIVWVIYWGWKAKNHFKGKDLTRTEKVVIE